MLLSKTPKFLPTPRPIMSSAVSQDCDLFGYRLIKTFNRFACKDYIDKARANAESVGIIRWKPKQFPYAASYYAEHIQDYFNVSKPFGTVWKQSNAACPGLKDFIVSFKTRTISNVADVMAGTRVKSNMPRSERTLIRNLQDRAVGYNISDKNFGPVLYSRDLYIEQCEKHLRDVKGTYQHTEKPRDLILQDVVQRLKNLLHECLHTKSLIP